MGHRLPAGLTFNYPNIKALATFLAGDLLEEAADADLAVQSAPVQESEVTPELDAVSDEQLLALFDDELATIEGLDL